jgi:hypothetical protein
VKQVSPALVRVVRHELTHALLHARGRGAVPRWLHEGIAQLMEPRDPARARDAVLHDAKGAAVDLEPFSYPKSLSFVAWLDQQYSRSRLLWLVDELAAGHAEPDAMTAAFGVPREELLEGWRQWLARSK